MVVPGELTRNKWLRFVSNYTCAHLSLEGKARRLQSCQVVSTEEISCLSLRVNECFPYFMSFYTKNQSNLHKLTQKYSFSPSLSLTLPRISLSSIPISLYHDILYVTRVFNYTFDSFDNCYHWVNHTRLQAIFSW